MKREIMGILPIPVYKTERELNISESESEEIKSIIEEGVHDRLGNLRSDNSYIFDNKLKKIKEFCDQHIKIYAKEIIDPKKELNFYITQSWLNITKPGGSHFRHWHPNSIISGVFYVSTVEDDTICFFNKSKTFEMLQIESNVNAYNTHVWGVSVKNNALILFPSWLEHSVERNEKASSDRISISFNVFMKGTIGSENNLNELILQ